MNQGGIYHMCARTSFVVPQGDGDAAEDSSPTRRGSFSTILTAAMLYKA